MLIVPRTDCIRCYFDSGSRTLSEFDSNELNVFYAETKHLSSRYLDIKRYITNDEALRANKFLFDEDRETYISCHAMLRLILANELNTNPSGILMINGKDNKPGLQGNPVYFNITHTREAFALTISRHYYVGIDMEKVNPGLDFYSIVKTYFSKRESDFILQSESEAKNRFFLLWTRKEALLKALGTGIINELTQIEVSGPENSINKKSLENMLIDSDSVSNEHFIYSRKLQENYLSVAIPCKATININHLNDENIVSYLD